MDFRRCPLALLLGIPIAFAAVRVGTFPIEVRKFFTAADGLPSLDISAIAVSNGKILARTPAGVAAFAAGKWSKSAAAFDRSQKLVATDSKGRIWVAHRGGVECRDANLTKVYTALEGLPYDDFTVVAPGENGVVWFGTHKGAIRFDGTTWEYREGLRWLPDDDVRDIAVEQNGNAWFATKNGVGLIERRPITLDEKAKFFESEIDLRHRRTQFQFVDSVHLKRAGDKSEWTQHDSDNDGLWTAMYGAGECYAYGATHDPAAKKRAQQAFEALWFLRVVTEGGPHPPPHGYVARTVLPASAPDPNPSAQQEEDMRKRDAMWKHIAPRWPFSADGKWYWKADTSSDELDGHYYFYALYYDLVATTDDEKRRVREQVSALTDHLVDHGFRLIDHDGKPTRWGVFDPDSLNHEWWPERPLNSLSMLSYLKTAEHITGSAKYRDAAKVLIEKHSYDTNVLIPKSGGGPGSGNQSDDEMAFMDFYNLVHYETDPRLLTRYALAFHNYWEMERPELNPFFNFLYAAVDTGKKSAGPFGTTDFTPKGAWLEESIDTLRRYPLDRVNWLLKNSHRKDIVALGDYANEEGDPRRGHLRNGKVLPIDERMVGHWNHDPWRLDQGGNGMELEDGASFLLSYYAGLYYKFIE